MSSRTVFLAGCLLAIGCLAGCGSEEITQEGAQSTDVTAAPSGVHDWSPGLGEVSAEDVARLQTVEGEKIYREWKKIYSVEVRGTEKVRTHVGFLEKKYSDSEPEGKYYVRDRKHDIRGFLLSEGRAYVVRGPTTAEQLSVTDLGNTGMENGVKKILDVPGGIEFDLVADASVAPPKA